MDTIDSNLNRLNRNSSCRESPDERIAAVLDVKNIVCGQSTGYGNVRMDCYRLFSDTIGDRDCAATVAANWSDFFENGLNNADTTEEKTWMRMQTLRIAPDAGL